MAKKVLNTSSGVVGLICAAFVVGVMFAGASPPALAQGATNIEQARAQIRASLGAGDVAADRMMDELVDTFRGSPYLAQTLFRLAEYWSETALKSEAAREEGDSRFMLEKTVELLEVITKECESSPLAVKAYLGIADCSRRLGKYEEAVDNCRQMVVRFPEAQEVCTAHIMIIQSYHDLGAAGEELPQTAREHILDALAGVETRCSGSNIARAAEQMAVALGITN